MWKLWIEKMETIPLDNPAVCFREFGTVTQLPEAHANENQLWICFQETERLHMEQVVLQRQVSFLQQEKEQLKMLLASHASICTLAQDKPHSLDTFLSRELLPSRISIAIKHEPLDDVSGSESLALQHADMQWNWQRKAMTYTKFSEEDDALAFFNSISL